MTSISVHYNKGVAIAALVVGVLALAAGALTGQPFELVLGVVLTLLGVLMLINPMIKIEGGEVQLRNPLGMTLKRHPVSSPTDLRFEDKKLYHVPTGKKIATLGFGVQAADVEQLRSNITQ